jgi:hypothetical protein
MAGKNDGGLIQGMDTIPKEIAKLYRRQLANWLPGWSADGVYNYRPGATTHAIGAQLDLPMHRGSHPWINKQVAALFEQLDADTILTPDQKTVRAAALINYMDEASSADAIKTGGSKTGGFIAFARRDDPILTAIYGGGKELPKPDMYKLYADNMTWDKIMASEAGQDVVRLNPKTKVALDANGNPIFNADGKPKLIMDYEGKLSGSSFLSNSADDINNGVPKTMTSSDWSAKYKTDLEAKGITFRNGVAVKDNKVYRRAETKTKFATKVTTATDVPGGAKKVPIGSLGKLSTRLLKTAGGVALSVVALVILAPDANAATLDAGYKQDKPNAANKKFIQELFSTTVGGLAGLIAGALAGAVSMGLLAIPAGVVIGGAGAAAGEWLGGLFYDNFTSAANEIVEWMAPILAPLGEFVNGAKDAIVGAAEKVEEAIGMIFSTVTEAFNDLGDYVTGVDGVFGHNGPLFGAGKPLHFLVDVAREKKFLQGDGSWAYDGFDNVLYGTDADDILIMDNSTGEAFGGKGDDVLLGINPRFAKEGTALFADDPDSPLADEDSSLLLDGGEGNDWVITVFGDDVPDKKPGAVTAGGLGRDWIVNSSPNGIIWGDVADSYKDGATGDWFFYDTQINAEGEEQQVRVDIADDKTNSDNIWFWADTTLMDAGHSDYLKYFGLPLTGGDANGGLAGYAIYGGLFGAAIGVANYAGYTTGKKFGWENEIYVDHIQPWMLYAFQADEDGNLDLYITNAFEQIFRGLMASVGLSQPLENRLHKGWMKIENVDVVGSRLGVLQQSAADQILSNGKKGGSLNMVFKALNPLQMLLPVIDLVPGLIGGALKYSIMADGLIGTMAAMTRWSESMKWSNPQDPLIIDLDGDGIETTSLDGSNAYFDVDGDRFAERTGWLKGDDGFLVLDANGNGRIDNISEMFGDRFAGGYDELRTYDSNGDGKISVADLIWPELQVWQDRNRDGITDAGELKSLTALGIVELSLNRSAISATTPQGAQLLGRGDVRFEGGRVTSRCAAAAAASAANDNEQDGAWPERTFCLSNDNEAHDVRLTNYKEVA